MTTGNRIPLNSSDGLDHQDTAQEDLEPGDPESWVLSAYHRETIFRGTNLESPAPTLALRISGFEPPLSSASPVAPATQVASGPVSPADSDPFSDYLSYESEQEGDIKSDDDNHVEYYTDGEETPKRFDHERLQMQQRRESVTEHHHRAPPSPRVQIPSRSPLDELCRTIQTPSDLPTSPSPFSPKPPRAIPFLSPTQNHVPVTGGAIPTFAQDARFESAHDYHHGPFHTPNINWPPSAVADIPNYSLPSFKQACAGSQEKSGAQGRIPGVRERLLDRYRRSAPILSCILAISLAVCLTVCSLGPKTEFNMMAKVPPSAFANLSNDIIHVELFPTGVCLMDSSKR
ncbi:hypothetical protein QFC19_001951 [Naganishia cerealis]|uniref:Uncharacterized protein n=1 Tax=Naganishia cerealis TaxID=610337 RepID=A0ACC2WFV3_9TREE|nr:hypothetical protein QFC19_001951 [Naganishia cerealis]